ncbi:hypothetical protein FM106_00775 [Brachybacterium faecium]|nr:hypothetical protein FM106_00775 [Brachybacterium faecium]
MESKLFLVIFMTKYNDEFKLLIVQEYLNGRSGYRYVSQKHGIVNDG